MSAPRAAATKFLTWGPRDAKHGLVFLHGWKMNGAGMRSSVKELLGGEPLPDVIMYFLTAPHHKDGDDSSPQWFAYHSDVTLNFSARDVMNSRARISQMVKRLRTRHRKRQGTLSLGGYSQGACMALDVALTMEVPMNVITFAGFPMLGRFVGSNDGWHGYPPLPLPLRSLAARKRRLTLWVYHGKQDTEITWGLAKRSYEAVQELRPETVRLKRLEVSDEDDHWSMWSSENVQAANLLRAAMGIAEEGFEEEEEEDAEEEEEEAAEDRPCMWDWEDLSDEQRVYAETLGYHQDSWYHNEERSESWQQVMATARTRDAALALGFSKDVWVVAEETEERTSCTPPAPTKSKSEGLAANDDIENRMSNIQISRSDLLHASMLE